MSDRMMDKRNQKRTSTIASPSLVSPNTPTLTNPIPGFGLSTNNPSTQTVTEVSTDLQETQSVGEKSLELQGTNEKSFGHDISCMSLHRPQAKLMLGKPGDKYEQKADMITNQVMSMSNFAVQGEAMSEGETSQTKFINTSIKKSILLDELETKPSLQRATDGSLQAGDNIESRLDSCKSGGSTLPNDVRSFMEPRFGADFSQVRVHTDGDAVQMNKHLQAQAFTHVNHIYYGTGKAPAKDELTAHELTHVVQQGGGVQTKPVGVQSLTTNILQKNVTHIVQLNGDSKKHILPEPVEVNWGGDPLQIEFRRIDEDGGRFEFVIHYKGSHPVSGPFVENKTKRVSTMIGSAKLEARVLRQTNTLVEVDLYGDGSRIVKLTDAVTFDSRPTSKGRQHDFNVMVLGKSVYASSFWVLDPNAKASDIPTTQPEESPGENPSSRLLGDWLTTEIRIDGDGDQYKELLLRVRAKSFWSDVGSSSPSVTQKDSARTVVLQIEQISTKQVREVTFDLPKPSIGGSLFPIVEEVTDGFGATKISLVLPSKTQWLEIYPPERTPQNVNYLVVAAGHHFSFGFPSEKSEIHKVAAVERDASVIGNIVSADIALGAYGDKFRFTVQPKSSNQAILGISPLYKDESLGGVGADLKIDGSVRFQVLLTGDVSLGIDLNGDKKPDLMIYDQLTTPEEVDGGGPPENNRNHRVRVVGEAIGGEKSFYFKVRSGTLMPITGNGAADKAAISNAQAVSGLKQQAAEGTFENQLDAYESALMEERKKAADTGLIRKPTYDAWAALSLAMIKLRPQITKTVDAVLQGEAAKQADAFYKSLADETKDKTKSIGATEVSSTSSNPYTDAMTTIAPLYASTTGAGPELAGNIKAGQWSKALANYQRLVSGLDQWILDRLKTVKGEHSTEAQRVGLLTGRKRELGEIEKHNPKRILAVFHPGEKFKGEQGYVTEFPLSLYYWKEGNTWHLKDITNPEKTYDYTVSAADNEQEVPLRLLSKLNDPDHFPVGVIHYDIPSKYAGEIKTTDHLTWKKFFTYLGLGLAAVGLTLSTFGTGTVAVVGAWVLAGSAIASATSATIDLVEHSQQGNLDATTAVIDIAQIVASLAGASALASGRIVQAAANAPAGARWAGNWARLAMFANKLYVPMVGTSAVADVVSFAVIAQDTAKQLDEIENGPGDRGAKDRAKALLLSQLAVMGGLTALSVKGTIPELSKGRSLVLHPGSDGVPVVSTALTKKSIVIDTNTAIALDKKAKGLESEMSPGEKAMVAKIEALGDVELRVADVTVTEMASKGGKVTQPGIAVTIDRTGKEYQDILQVLTDNKVGKAKGAADRAIVADTFFAVPEPGVTPTFATHDPGIYNNLARITGYEPAKAGPVPQKFPNGFDVTINGRTIKVIPIVKQ